MQQTINTGSPSWGAEGSPHSGPSEPPSESESAPSPEPKVILNSYADGVLNDEQLIATLSARCRGDEEAIWETLSLLDQYHRRGLLDTSIFLTAKTELNALVFGGRRHHAANVPDRDAMRAPVDENRDLRPHSAKRESINTESKRAAQPTTHQTTRGGVRGGLRPGALLRERYVLVAPQTLTRTAMIFNAFDRQRTGLPESDAYVSVKCLSDEFANSVDAQHALEAEFASASRLSHPNILRVYEFHADGPHSFLTMEPLQGQLLSHTIERFAPQSLHPSQARRIVREVGLALQHAHQHNIFHLNLSASTVLIQPSGEVRVFGFAAMPAKGHPSASGLRAQPFKEDLFALACLAYHVLSGREPFAKTNGKLERRWHRLEGLPINHWRAIELVLGGGETRQWKSVLDWLTSFDGGAADKVAPLNKLQPFERPAPAKRTHIKIGVAATLLIAAAATWLWLPMQQVANTSVTNVDGMSRADTDVASNIATADKQIDSQVDVIAAPTPAQESDPPSEASPATPTVLATVAKEPSTANSPSDAIESTVLKPTPVITPTTDTSVKTIPSKPVVSFAESPVVVNQGESVAKLTLRRTGPTREKLALRWRTAEGSAKAHAAFIPADDGAVEFAPGARTAQIYIPLVNGKPTRYSQWFSVELMSNDNSELGAIPSATVFISKAETLADAGP